MTHKGYNIIDEFGEWVAYKSKSFKNMGFNSAQRAEDGKTPTDIDRIVLGTSSLSEAMERLDRKLEPTKRASKKADENQLRIE